MTPEAFKAVRLQYDMTQAEYGAALNLNCQAVHYQSAVSRYERGLLAVRGPLAMLAQYVKFFGPPD